MFSTFGDSHPGSGHLDGLVSDVMEGASAAGARGARYFGTDMCDGESQGTDGINYSLASREMLANLIEIQANATPFDAGVYIASCDKGMPGSALLPATSDDLHAFARRAGMRAVEVAGDERMRPSVLLTHKSFENAILVHAAISGSTNALMYLPAIAHELGMELSGDDFDRLHRGAHYLLDLRPTGRWPAEFFYYAGGVPRIMEELGDVLDLDVRTITGKTLGDNLEELREGGFYERCQELLAHANEERGLTLTHEDIIRPFDHPLGSNGSIAVLKGNLAPDGAVIKHTACPSEIRHPC